MSWLEIMWIVGAVVSCVFLYILYLGYKENLKCKSSSFGDSIAFVVVLIFVIVFFCGIIHFWIYSASVSIPYEYQALINNVEDMEEYLMKYENISDEEFGSIGQGLESLEYKQQLQRSIRYRNEKHAEICSMLNNFWTPYKDLIISNLPPGTYGSIIIGE